MLAWLGPVAVVAIVFIVVVGIISLLARAKGGVARPSEERPPFRKNKYFLTDGERSFYGVLKHAAGERFDVFAKVRLADLVWLPKGVEGRQGWQNRVDRKHVDFVLCEPTTVTPVLVIELDDKSHRRPGRQARDALVDGVLRAAGLPILRIPAQASYDPTQLRAEVLQAAGASPPA